MIVRAVHLGAPLAILASLAFSVGLAAPLPLTADEIAALKAGAAASRQSLAVTPPLTAATRVTGKTAREGVIEALDLILAEGSDYLVGVYLNDSAALPAEDVERRVLANYDKPALAVPLFRRFQTYQSLELYRRLLQDARDYAAPRREDAARCKTVSTVIGAPTDAPLPGMNARAMAPQAPGATGGVQPTVPHAPLRVASSRTLCRTANGEWQPKPGATEPFDPALRDRRAGAIWAITRTSLQGIEGDVLQLADMLSMTMETERHGPGALEVSGLPARRVAPPQNLVTFIAERRDARGMQRLCELLDQIVSQGAPFAPGDVGAFAVAVATMDTSHASRSAADALRAIARLPETPLRDDRIEAIVQSLGTVLPGSQIDLPALKAEVMPNVAQSSAKIARAFDRAILANAGLRNPDPDSVVTLLQGATLSRQARYAIERLPDVNAKTRSGQTLLNRAMGIAEARALLLARGADPNLPGENGFTALHMASARGDGDDALALVDRLRSRGADVNARASDGRTPLHVALGHRDTGLVKALLAAGADVNAEDRENVRPLTAAWYSDELQALIRDRGGTESAITIEARNAREKFVTRRHSIRTARWIGWRCDEFELQQVCRRLRLREADEIQILSPRDMRLTFYSGKRLVDDGSVLGKSSEREKYVALVRDREVVEGYRTQQVIDWRNAGCAYAPGYGSHCIDEKRQYCEKWKTHDDTDCR